MRGVRARRTQTAPAPAGVNGQGSSSPSEVSPEGGASYASGARILSVGIASTGIFTFAYLATSSHVLSQSAYGRVSLCWSIMFVILSVIYRPVEQLLSRTIADRRARGLAGPFPAGARADPGWVRAGVPRCGAQPAPPDRAQPVRRLGRSLLDPGHRRTGLRGELFCPRLAGRPPAFRTLWRPGVPGVDLAIPVSACGRGGHRLRSGGRRPGHGGGALRVPVGHPVRVFAGQARGTGGSALRRRRRGGPGPRRRRGGLG